MTLDELRAKLSMANSYSRLGILFDCYLEVSRASFCRVLGEEWSDSDNHWQFQEALKAILGTRGPRRRLMTPPESAAWDALPKTVTCYRGCGEINRDGASWSLDKATAAAFPTLARYKVAHPLLITANVMKSRILAVKLERGEIEIITFSARPLTVEPLLPKG